jgi:DNA-binding IclR family transcriptional regulator
MKSPAKESHVQTRGKDTYSIQSVEHALDVLEALSEEGDEVRISQLSARLGMNKASVFRLLATFENRGYVERERGSGKYRLGLSAYEIGQKFLSRMGLLRKARPVMERLARQCNETVYLAVRRKEEVLFLDMVDTAHQVKILSLVGRRFPLPATAAGKILLAFGGTSGQQADNSGGNSAGQPVAAEELAAIRLRSYSCDCHGVGAGIACVAVPLLKGDGEVAGALALLGPDFRMPPEKIEKELLPQLREAGEVVSSRLGFLGHYLESQPL